jgi:hypothetical protein
MASLAVSRDSLANRTAHGDRRVLSAAGAGLPTWPRVVAGLSGLMARRLDVLRKRPGMMVPGCPMMRAKPVDQHAPTAGA